MSIIFFESPTSVATGNKLVDVPSTSALENPSPKLSYYNICYIIIFLYIFIPKAMLLQDKSNLSVPFPTKSNLILLLQAFFKLL